MCRFIRYLLWLIVSISPNLTAADELIDNDARLQQRLNQIVLPFEENNFPLNQVAGWIADKSLVLLGDGTHGSQEFYHYRAELTRYLIAKKGFSAVIVEGNWPGGQLVNRFVTGDSTIQNAQQALSGFNAYFPWVWNNQTLADFVDWLRAHNRLHSEHPVAFYGMDLFSLYPSIAQSRAILQNEPLLLRQQLDELYHCFDGFRHNAVYYGKQAATSPTKSCQKAANRQYRLIHEKPILWANASQSLDLRMNSLIIQAAERYFRMINSAADKTWNDREQMMIKVIEAVRNHLPAPAKVIIWAHNSHTGDARGTGMGKHGDLSLGQLLREKLGKEKLFLLGSLSYQGQVTASSQWGAPAEVKTLVPAADGSYAALFHQLGMARFVLNLTTTTPPLLLGEHYQRFVGVAYDPTEEFRYNYNTAHLEKQFDALLFVDKTHALQMLSP